MEVLIDMSQWTGWARDDSCKHYQADHLIFRRRPTSKKKQAAATTHHWHTTIPCTMKSPGQKETLAFISLAVLIAIWIYTCYQNTQPKFIHQQNYNTKNITKLQADNATLKHSFTVKGNYLATDHLNSYQSESSGLVSPSFRRPPPLPVPLRCLPFFNELHVMPVPEHGEERTTAHYA